MRMKTKFFLVRVAAVFFTASLATPSVWAAEELPQDVSRNTHRVDERRLPPSERVRLNAERAKADPTLRAKWDSKGWTPASVTSLRIDNMPQDILSRLRQDPDLADRPMKIKVSSKDGAVALEGVVNDGKERELVARKVSRMEGVKKVENRLVVKSTDEDLK